MTTITKLLGYRLKPDGSTLLPLEAKPVSLNVIDGVPIQVFATITMEAGAAEEEALKPTVLRRFVHLVPGLEYKLERQVLEKLDGLSHEIVDVTPLAASQPPEHSDIRNSVQEAAKSLAEKIIKAIKTKSQPHDYLLDRLEFLEEVRLRKGSEITIVTIKFFAGEAIVSRISAPVRVADEVVVSNLAAALQEKLGDDLQDATKPFEFLVNRVFIRNSSQSSSEDGTCASVDIYGFLETFSLPIN
jgi:hypothetical protein